MKVPVMQNRNFRLLLWSFILLIVLIPTYFIHSEKYPDWGDDFAQYIYQSQQINSPSKDYKQVLNVEEYSSPKRSVVFSLVLSIVHPTILVQNYVNLISIFYILAGICFFLFLCRYFSHAVSLIGTLCVFYNFLFLRLKSEVVPEFLFIAFFYGVLHLISSPSKQLKYLIPVLLALLVSVRFIGLSLAISYAIFLFVQRDKPLKETLKNLFTGVLIFSGIVLSVNYLVLPSVNNQEVKLYSGLVFKNYSLSGLLENISIYPRYLLLFFEQEIPFWMNYIIKFLAVLFLLIGFIASLMNKITILHISCVIYFLFLFIYPYNGDTIKYLIPVFPLVIYFILTGVQSTLEFVHFRKTEPIVGFCFCIILLSNSKTIWLAMQRKDINVGPYDLSVLADFDKVKDNVGIHESIAFGKPFIINLLADRNSYFLSQENSKMVFSKATYFLSPKEKVSELYPKIVGIRIEKGDTIELNNFYLVRLAE